MAASRPRLSITREESDLPVWQQVQNNGSLRYGAIEIRDASSPEPENDLDYDTQDDNFSDEDFESSDEEDDEDLKLRGYQIELAQVALTGRSCVICAPTGSGKTKVAVHIILEHLKRVPNAKIAFFARTVPLAKQQCQTIKNHLPRNREILLMNGGSEHSMSLHKLIPYYSVFVLTPMILVNHLCGRRPLMREGVTVFTLMVFDECHHTREEEPYNNIMYYYLKEKRLGRNMPQVVGLTASIGVEKASTQDEAKDNIMKVCGNLDVDHLAIVKRNVAELQEKVPVPREMERCLEENIVYDATLKILDIMKELEEIATACTREVNNATLSSLMSEVPPSKKLPEYCQWVVKLQDAVKTVNTPDVRRETVMPLRNINIITHYLKEYHFALESIELAQIPDVIKFLDRGFVHFRLNNARASQENRFYKLFEDLKELVSRQDAIINVNLEILAEVLRHFVVRKGHETRAIVFVRTRMLAQAVSSWLCRCGEDDLMNLNASKFTSTNVPEEVGGMTESQQQTALADFRSGKVRVLVATSVGEEGLDIHECNLVVKYNHIGNEVSKVQTRGRSRAFDGVSVLLGMSHILQREKMNKIRVQLMESALAEISEKSQNEFRRDVDSYQATLFHAWDAADAAEELRRLSMRNAPFRVYCHLCRKVLAQSTNIRTIYEKYRVSIDRELLDHVQIVPTEETPMDQLVFVGTARCLAETEPGKSCGSVIGTVIKHKGCPYVTLGVKNIVFQCNNEDRFTKKQWKKVPLFVEELSHDDRMEYAMTIFPPAAAN